MSFKVRDLSKPAKVNITLAAGDRHIIGVEHADLLVDDMDEAVALCHINPRNLAIVASDDQKWW